MKRALDIAARTCGILAAIFLAAMMLLTVADIALRAFFSYPIRGQLELVELGLACTIFLALPAVFIRDAHIVVDVADHFVSARAKELLDLLGALASLATLAVMLWQMAPLALYMMRFGDVTSDLSIPKIWYWGPVLFGVACSTFATVVFIARWRRSA